MIFYRLNTAQFASEIGYHGCPAVSSLKKFISEDELWPMKGSRQWLVHNTEHPRYSRGFDRNELMAKQVRMLFGEMPEKIEDFAFASQFSQAEAKKFFIEQFRMKKWDKTGIIWWNLIDGWPQISDSVVDYYFHAKLAYHFIARSQRDVQVVMDEYKSWEHAVWAVNDTLSEVKITCHVTDGESGEMLLEKESVIPGNGKILLGSITANLVDERLYIMSWEVNGEAYNNHYISRKGYLNLERARAWVDKLAGMSPAFNAEDCWN